MQRLILLLLDLPLATRNPALASDWIIQLADATAREDRREIASLESRLHRLRQTEGPGSRSFALLIEPGSANRPLATANPAREEFSTDAPDDPSSEQVSLGSPQPRAPKDLITPQVMENLLVQVRSRLRQIVFKLAETSVSAPKIFEQELDKIVQMGEALTVGAELETLAGGLKTRKDVWTMGPYLDSLQDTIVGAGDGSQTLESLLVLVRARLRQLIFEITERSVLTPKIVEQEFEKIVRQMSQHSPDLFWSLNKGSEVLQSKTRPGEPFRDRVDVAWAVLCRTAVADLHAHYKALPANDWQTLSMIQAIQKTVAYFDTIISARLAEIGLLHDSCDIDLKTESASSTSNGLQLRMERLDVLHHDWKELSKETRPEYSTSWTLALKHLLAGDMALADDPDLSVRLAGILCQSSGTFTWETCLALANSRAKFHRFIEVGADTPWRVKLDARTGHDGTIEIPFSVVEQPLSAQFRLFFEEQDLEGKIRVLWQLVRYAATLRVSLLHLTSADAQRQVLLREEDLWQAVSSGPEADSFIGKG